MSSPLVLVTGASGYLSTHVVKLLQDEGHRVRGTVRSLKNEAKVKHLKTLSPGAKYPLELVEADLTKEEGWDEAVSGCTFVHHIASPFTLANPTCEDDMIKPAVEGTLMVLRACAKAGTVKRVVLTSSIYAVINKGGNQVPASEVDWANTEFPNLPTYNKSKILAEKAAWDYVNQLPESKKFELAVVNPGGIMGPALHGTPGVSTEVVKRLLMKEVPMMPHLNLIMVDVRDCALAHLRCQTLPEAAGHRHILRSETLWLHEMVAILDKEFSQYGYQLPKWHMPDFLFTVITWFSKSYRSTKVVNSEPMNLDNTRMTKVLGITPIDHEKTLIDMGYSLIDQGFVTKTPDYRPRSSPS